VWLLLLPHHPFLVFGPASAFLGIGPIFRDFYVPIVLLAAAVIVRLVVMLARPQWRAFALGSRIVQAVATLVLVNAIINAASHTVSADWHPFVTVASTLRGTDKYAQFVKIAAIVNVSILIAFVGTWIGVSIGGAIQTWEFLKYIRKQRISHEPASLQVQ
jgi:hypothetical protein